MSGYIDQSKIDKRNQYYKHYYIINSLLIMRFALLIENVIINFFSCHMQINMYDPVASIDIYI